MTLQLTKASDKSHKKVSVLLFGEPKIGKTSLAKTLPVEDDSKVLYVAADPGQLVLRGRDFVVAEPHDRVLSETFMEDVYKHVASNPAQYNWVFIDGVNELADAILKNMMISQRNGLKAYGEMAEYTESWMKKMRDIRGTSAVFVTHIDRIQDADTGSVKYIPQFPGKEINRKVNGWFDLIGCMRLVQSESSGPKRMIQFYKDADPKYEVGDRSGALAWYEEPNLNNIFRKIHDAGYVAPVDKDALLQEAGGIMKRKVITLDKLIAAGYTNPREMDAEALVGLVEYLKGV